MDLTVKRVVRQLYKKFNHQTAPRVTPDELGIHWLTIREPQKAVWLSLGWDKRNRLYLRKTRAYLADDGDTRIVHEILPVTVDQVTELLVPRAGTGGGSFQKKGVTPV